MLTLISFLKVLSKQMLIVSSNGTLVNRDSMSKLVIKCAQLKEGDGQWTRTSYGQCLETQFSFTLNPQHKELI